MVKMHRLHQPIFEIDPKHAAVFREMGLDAAGVFNDPRIRVWRSLSDRENATLDYMQSDGANVRFHIKRYPAGLGTVAAREVAGHRLLVGADIAAAPIIAHGALADGRTFVILQDLAGFTPGDKLVEQGIPFERLLSVTARLTAKLHNARLHHRDLYFCHFMIRYTANAIDAKLIDMARVAEMNNLLTRPRWLVKDLAQFWYSTTKVAVSDEQRTRWLSLYAEQRGVAIGSLQASVEKKAAEIARHDIELNRRQPSRNVSIPTAIKA